MRYRLYNDVRVEYKLAKLYLYTMGQFEVKPMQKLDNNLNLISGFTFNKYMPYEDITLTLRQIEHISGLTKVSLRELDFFNRKEIISLWNISLNRNKTVTIAARKQDNLREIIERCYFILKK